MANEENPFKTAIESGDAKFTPFGHDVNMVKAQQLRSVKELGLVSPDVIERLPQIADLTVRDLNDLAAEFSGVPTNNSKVSQLSLEDIQDIESVFFDFKVAAGRDLARGGRDNLAAVDVSCCCCTPCCCCAATDMTASA